MSKKNDTVSAQIFRQLCIEEGLPVPEAEYLFHPSRKWRVDFFFSYAHPEDTRSIRLALEVEGGVWSNGRHTRGSGFVKDMEKYNALAVEGILLARVVPSDLYKKKTFNLIRSILNA